ncbi:hypothetical protein STENM223S_06950 [Streptomyces tendae]
MPREAGTSRIFFSLPRSRVPSVLSTNRESRLTPSNGVKSDAVPSEGASPPGVESFGA